MSPHQREFSFEASAVKSRRIRSARAAAAGSGIVVFFQRRAARPASPAAHQPGDALAAVPAPFAAQLGVHPRRAVGPLDSLCTARISAVSTASARSRRDGPARRA